MHTLAPSHSNGRSDRDCRLCSGSALEDRICQSIVNDKAMDERLPTPMVLIVVAGGIGTVNTIMDTLEKSRPVIVLADSGGVATQIYEYFTSGKVCEQISSTALSPYGPRAVSQPIAGRGPKSPGTPLVVRSCRRSRPS